MIIGYLVGSEKNEIKLNKPSILVAEKLTTNQFAAIKSEFILGIIIAKGGTTDNLIILAKALGIPSLINAGLLIEKIETVDKLVLDTLQSTVFIEPSPTFIQTSKNSKESF